jgi:hypothetical protein
MRESDVVPKLVRIIPCSHDRLVELSLRLLFNLSFDATLREQMVRGDYGCFTPGSIRYPSMPYDLVVHTKSRYL